MIAKSNAACVPVEPPELGTSEALPVSSLMHHDDYSIQFDEWLDSEHEIQRRGLRSKPFIGDRSYRHFDGRVSIADLESNQSPVIPYLKDPNKLKSYSFFPFVRRDRKVRRFTREINSSTGKKEVRIKQKLRPIMYASHQDACVYGFYAYMLKAEYDSQIRTQGLHNSVIAYRKIPRDDDASRNKSNIDFANDIYKAVRRQNSAAIIAIDIRDFFRSMNHKLIKEKWESLLGNSSLPVGHQIIFRNITSYRYLFLYEAMEVLGLGKLRKGKFNYNDTARREGQIADSKQFNKVLNNSTYIHKNSSPKGIPQGSPISDIIANFYLLEFDLAVTAHLSQFSHAIYKRYSDDILIVCPQQSVKIIYAHIQKLLDREALQVNEDKTELFFIDKAKQSLVDSTAKLVPNYTKNKSTVQYLGFEFDLKDIHIRSVTIASHYRKIVSKMKANSGKETPRIKKPKKYTKKRDRYAYIKLASKRINSARLYKQHNTVRKRTAKLRKMNKDRQQDL